MALEFPNIDPVAFAIGPVEIRWYALAYMAGFILGWRYCLYLAGRNPAGIRPTKEDIDDYLPWAILGVIIGGRAGYVLFYQPALYWAEPLRVLRVWEGGMAFHGGVVGVILSLLIYSYVRKIPVLRLSDMLACAAPVGLFLGRIANFINGELFGRVSDMPWAVVFPRGGEQPRHPSQLYEAALEGLVLFVILFALSRKGYLGKQPGLVSGVFLAGYAVFRMIVELFRAPDVQIGFLWDFFTMGQILSLPMFLFGLGLIIFSYAKMRHEPA